MAVPVVSLHTLYDPVHQPCSRRLSVPSVSALFLHILNLSHSGLFLHTWDAGFCSVIQLGSLFILIPKLSSFQGITECQKVHVRLRFGNVFHIIV